MRLIPIYSWTRGVRNFNKRNSRFSKQPWAQGVILLLVLSLTGCGVKEAGQQSPDAQKQDGTKEAEMFDFEKKTII